MVVEELQSPGLNHLEQSVYIFYIERNVVDGTVSHYSRPTLPRLNDAIAKLQERDFLCSVNRRISDLKTYRGEERLRLLNIIGRNTNMLYTCTKIFYFHILIYN